MRTYSVPNLRLVPRGCTEHRRPPYGLHHHRGPPKHSLVPLASGGASAAANAVIVSDYAGTKQRDCHPDDRAARARPSSRPPRPSSRPPRRRARRAVLAVLTRPPSPSAAPPGRPAPPAPLQATDDPIARGRAPAIRTARAPHHPRGRNENSFDHSAAVTQNLFEHRNPKYI